ncbi:hypothetical protein DSECCO2_621980 [anaerobic digester metagenome]
MSTTHKPDRLGWSKCNPLSMLCLDLLNSDSVVYSYLCIAPQVSIYSDPVFLPTFDVWPDNCVGFGSARNLNNIPAYKSHFLH